MKTIRILNCIVATLMLLLASCTDEIFDDSRVEEGLPAKLTIKVCTESNAVVSRVALDTLTENRVKNLYLFIFDATGNVHYRGFFGPSELAYNETTSSGKLQVNTSSLNGAKIVGIANVNTADENVLYQISDSDLKNVKSLEELENLVVHQKSDGTRSGTIERTGILLMSGFAQNADGTTSVNIPPANGAEISLNLRRVDAKVKFVFTPDPPSDKGWTDFTFRAKKWTIKRVPSQTLLIEKADGDYDGAGAEYFTSLERDFEVRDVDKKESSFEFYMPENKKTPIKNVGDYAQRDAWENKTEDGRIFTNANANSTYAEITGSISYKQADGTSVNADVRFIIHLGENDSDPNNYETKRNTYYTYNVKVCGVNDIVVEVDKGDSGPRPGYEGDVIYNKAESFEFDSHYDRCLIKINPSLINMGYDIQWAVSTPFSRGIHKVDINNPNDVEEALRDYRWIKFAINKDYGVDGDQYVKYPGDQNYNDPYPLTGAANNQSSPYYSGYPNARLLDINQLCKRLAEESSAEESNNDTQALAITVFVDEYLYYKNPITGEEGNNKCSLWKLTTDKEDRSLHLIVEDAKLSQDHNSSHVTAQFTFKQRAIQTVYDPDKEDLTTAWGLESKMEGERMKIPKIGQEQQGRDDSYNGRKNTWDYIKDKNLKWTDVLNVNNPYQLNSGYERAIYACLMRNRDLNGDNIIQENEVRWYLAAIDQLVDIFIGEAALDEESRLYPRNASDRDREVRWHYVSSTTHTDGGTYILWAEEGASKNSHRGDVSEDMNYSYRCVRNLGLPLDEKDSNGNPLQPTSLAQWTKESDGCYLFDLSNLNPKARRQAPVKAELPPHNERDALNRPYVKFRVGHKEMDCPNKPADYNAGGKNEGSLWSPKWRFWMNWNDAYTPDYYRSYTVAGKYSGWRVPNHRELLLISRLWKKTDLWDTYYSRFDNWLGTKEDVSEIPRYMCGTKFSLNGVSPYVGDRNGFFFNPNNGGISLYNGNATEPYQKGYVRPVQDVE